MDISRQLAAGAGRTFTARLLAANACHSMTNDGKKLALAMTLQTTVAIPSGPMRSIAGIAMITLTDDEDRGKGIAAHHPLTVLLDLPDARAVNCRARGHEPPEGLDGGSHKDGWYRERDGDGNGNGRGDDYAGNVDVSHDALQLEMALA